MLVFVLVFKVYARMFLCSLHVYHELNKTLSTIMSNAKYSDFCCWFHAHKEDVIRDTMLLPIQEEAGLGSPEPFYTNSSKCNNSVLKVKVYYKRTQLLISFISIFFS